MAFGNYEFPHSHNYDSDLRELINLVHQYKDEYQAMLDEVNQLSADFKAISEEFIALTTKVDGLFDYVDSRLAEMFDSYRREVDAELGAMKAEIQTALALIATILPAAKAYTDAKTEEVKQEIITSVNDMLSTFQSQLNDLRNRLNNLNVEAKNPFTGYKDAPGPIIEYYNRYFRVHALTNNEYDDLGITNAQYSDMLLSNWDYLIDSRRLKQDKFKRLNPVTGQLTSDYNIHSYLAGLFLGTLTADDYAAQNLTNLEYESLDLTNEDYFFTTAESLPWVLPTQSTEP